jgi:uncharacterized protein YxjI
MHEEKIAVDLTIKEQKVSFTSEYDITTPKDNYYARKKILSVVDQLEVQLAGGAHVARIEGQFSPLHSRHTFLFQDGRNYEFACDKLWTQVYKCEGNGETYWLYQHKGLKFSLFKDDHQIAALEKNRVVFGGGNEYLIQMDADADVLVTMCIALTINTLEYDDDDNTVTIDFGSIGPEERPYDPTWQPQ